MIIFVKFLQLIFRIIFLLPKNAGIAVMHLAANTVFQIARRTKIKKQVAKNIQLVLPQSNLIELADKSLKNLSLSIFNIICTPFFSEQHFHDLVKWHGLKKIEKALLDKKGLILITMHFGNYEIISSLPHFGFNITNIFNPSDNPVLQIVNQSRLASGGKLISAEEANMYRESLKALERNEIIGILADTGALESRHSRVKFLGNEVPVATGWLTLAQRAKCPVIPIISIRQGYENHLYLEDPFYVTKDNRDQVIQNALNIFENYVRKHPDHWLIFLNSYETERMMGLKG